MRYLLPLSLLIVSIPALASPPPPPPAFVMAAGEVLKAPGQHDAAAVARFFAEDVVVSEGGHVVATGKAAWLVWRTATMQHYDGRTLGYSEGWSRDGKQGGELMVVDTFDDVDRSTLPPNFIVDPRMKTRATLYRFASDGLIHAIDIARVEGFWMTH